jgi:hypothetical protein
MRTYIPVGARQVELVCSEQRAYAPTCEVRCFFRARPYNKMQVLLLNEYNSHTLTSLQNRDFSDRVTSSSIASLQIRNRFTFIQ